MMQQAVRAVARVLITNPAGELLLCRSRNGKAWVPPGGTLDCGETLREAAVREAMEEAGLPVAAGPLVYLQEFQPAGRNETVIETAFRATALAERPADGTAGLQAAGEPERPWRGWFLQDIDGPRREVRWFTRAEVAALAEPVYPAFLREAFWEGGADPYLGAVKGT